MLVTGHFIKNYYSLTVLQSDFEKEGIFQISEENLFTFQTNLSSGLEGRLSAKTYPADTKLLEAMKAIKNKNIQDIKQEV